LKFWQKCWDLNPGSGCAARRISNPLQ